MKLLADFLKQYKGLCVLALIAMGLDVVGALYIPTLVAEMINIGVVGERMDLIIEKGVMMLVAAFVSGAGTIAGYFLCARLSARLARDIRNAIYDKSLRLSSYEFEQYGAGSMITRTLNDVNVVQQAFTWTVEMVLPVPVMCIAGVAMAFSIDRIMGFLLIGITGIVLAAAILITRKASLIFEKLQEYLDRINAVVRENITGVRVIRAFNREGREEERMHRSFLDYAEASIKANTLFFALESLAFFVLNISIVAILWQSANRVGIGRMQIGDITALTEYALLILFYVIMAQMVIIMLPRAVVCLKRIREVLDADLKTAAGSMSAIESKDQALFQFHDAAFRFDDADAPTLQGLSFSLDYGQTTAVIGSTGSGKSTVAKLLLRFHDVTQGAITLDGKDIRGFSRQEVRERISYVPQKSWLFSGTIADNLRYGRESAGEADILHALDVAQADFVGDLSDGIYSAVAQGGTNFSGGQKQRLAIARALLKKADLYIFDDSFSALDFKTDAALRQRLAVELKDSAVLIIAQRVNTIVGADQIIVLENGKIAGRGKHQELLETCSVYRDIVASQTKGGGQRGV